MKARIRKDGNFWVGEVYGTWSMLLGTYNRVGWGCVTERCYTKFGAKKLLKKWKEKHFGLDMDL